MSYLPGIVRGRKNKMRELKGIVIPAVTPFDINGTLRLDWLISNYREWNETRVSGYMALGSNGEFRSLSDDEAFQVIKTASEVIAEDKLLIAGVGRESLYQTMEFIWKLEREKISIDYVSVLTPGYFKSAMTDEVLIDYYQTIANHSSYPILIYCAPKFSNGVCISPMALQILADHPNIAGIKDTSSDMMEAYMEAVGERADFEVFSGSLENIMSCFHYGGKGGIISSANYFPNTCARLYELYEQNGIEGAMEYFNQLKLLAKHTGGSAGVAGVKAVMNMMGYAGGLPRKPVFPCDESFHEKVQNYIKANSDCIIDTI
jgi:4-hydroxy-2-oxoglutarate aldolase